MEPKLKKNQVRRESEVWEAILAWKYSLQMTKSEFGWARNGEKYSKLQQIGWQVESNMAPRFVKSSSKCQSWCYLGSSHDHFERSCGDLCQDGRSLKTNDSTTGFARFYNLEGLLRGSWGLCCAYCSYFLLSWDDLGVIMWPSWRHVRFQSHGLALQTRSGGVRSQGGAPTPWIPPGEGYREGVRDLRGKIFLERSLERFSRKTFFERGKESNCWARRVAL